MILRKELERGKVSGALKVCLAWRSHEFSGSFRETEEKGEAETCWQTGNDRAEWVLNSCVWRRASPEARGKAVFQKWGNIQDFPSAVCIASHRRAKFEG